MTRSDKAVEYFKQGYNCSQAVALAFFDLIDVDQKLLLKAASGFGGGMGRLRETCGAVSGMILIANLLYGYDTSGTDLLKKDLYKKIQDLALKFEKENGSLVCRNLLGLNEKHSDYIPSKRNENFYKKRPCMELVKSAANILEDYIENNK